MHTFPFTCTDMPFATCKKKHCVYGHDAWPISLNIKANKASVGAPAGLRIAQLGALCRHFSFKHAHRWSFQCRPRGPLSFYLNSEFTKVNQFLTVCTAGKLASYADALWVRGGGRLHDELKERLRRRLQLS